MPTNTVTITVNGVQLPPMKQSCFTLIPHKLWGANSGRNNSTGVFVGDLVTINYELQLSWENITDDEFAIIDAAVNSMQPFLSVTFCPKASTGYITRSFYANDPQYPIKARRATETLYGAVTATLIEK